MPNKISVALVILFMQSCVFVNQQLMAQHCRMKDTTSNHELTNTSTRTFSNRSAYSFQVVFHVLYFKESENIKYSQILSQMEALREIYHHPVNANDISIPAEFRMLKANPDIDFCMAQKDPNGFTTDGVTRTKINDASLACKKFMGMKEIMHTSLGGLDVWPTDQYINIYVVNFMDNCNLLGETIFPWDSRPDEDGIIIDYRALGFIGAAQNNVPFNLAKTLVHEMGHYFGLKHLSDGANNNCLGDDQVSDTPVQSHEYTGCPSYPQYSCGTTSMTMNYMSLVDDACMHLFTKEQVTRMHAIIDQYKSELKNHPCSSKTNSTLDQLIWSYNDDSWQIRNPDGFLLNSKLELFDITGKLLWLGDTGENSSVSFPQPGMNLQAGIYFLRIHQNTQYKIIKLIKYS